MFAFFYKQMIIRLWILRQLMPLLKLLRKLKMLLRLRNTTMLSVFFWLSTNCQIIQNIGLGTLQKDESLASGKCFHWWKNYLEGVHPERKNRPPHLVCKIWNAHIHKGYFIMFYVAVIFICLLFLYLYFIRYSRRSSCNQR